MWPLCWHAFLVYQKIFVSGGYLDFAWRLIQGRLLKNAWVWWITVGKGL
jgi:hypothetical protein